MCVTSLYCIAYCCLAECVIHCLLTIKVDLLVNYNGLVIVSARNE